MRPLVAMRRQAPFDPHFVQRHALLWPIAPASRALGAYDDFPPVEHLTRVFACEPPVRFVLAPPRRRRSAPVDSFGLYDARITRDRLVPTRARCWHDLMNALVWGSFPHAKLALHARQHRAISERITQGDRRLPAARTPELDALALFDEGGVVLRSPIPCMRGGHTADATDAVVFGHAIYESLVLGVAPAVVAAITLPPPARDAHPLEAASGAPPLDALDRVLAEIIGDARRLRTPRELRRVSLQL